MSTKGRVCNTDTCGNKKHRKSVTLERKLEVLKRFEGGERGVDIGRSLGLPPTTVRTILSNSEKIKACAQSVTPLAATKLTRKRSSIMENMEGLLYMWLMEMHRCNSPCSLMAIQMKALSLFEDLKRKQGSSAESETFVASRGWFERFKKRSKLHNIFTDSPKIGELPSVSTQQQQHSVESSDGEVLHSGSLRDIHPQPETCLFNSHSGSEMLTMSQDKRKDHLKMLIARQQEKIRQKLPGTPAAMTVLANTSANTSPVIEVLDNKTFYTCENEATFLEDTDTLEDDGDQDIVSQTLKKRKDLAKLFSSSGLLTKRRRMLPAKIYKNNALSADATSNVAQQATYPLGITDESAENDSLVMTMYSNLLQIAKDNCYNCGSEEMTPDFVTRGQELFVTVSCNKCNIVTNAATHKLGEINRQTCLNIYAELLNGGGYQNFVKYNDLRENLDLNTFRKFTRFITERAVAECKKILQESRDSVFAEYAKNGILPDNNGVLDVNVSFNVTWQSRDFYTKMGLCVVTEADTGLVLDYQTLTKYCNRCSNLHTLYNDKKITTEHFLLQRAKHEPVCKIFDASSSSDMEARAAEAIWGRSLTYNMRYLNLISEGDVTPYTVLNNMNNGLGPYFGPKVNEVEWVDHYAKRLKSRLIKLIEENHVVREINGKKTKMFLMKGKGKLSDDVVDKLVYYFGRAIKESIGTSIETMRNTILARYFHCTSSDAEPNHNLCPTSKSSWCFYNKAIAKNVEIPSHSTMKVVVHLKPAHHEQVLRVYKDLTEDDMMQRCLDGLTKRPNENFHQRVWTYCPKGQYRNKRSLDLAVAQATAEYTCGYRGGSLDTASGFQRNAHTHLFLKKQDNNVKDWQRIMLVCDRCEMRYVDETCCAVMCSLCVKEEGIRSSHLDNKCRSCGLIYCLDGESVCPGCSFIPYGEFVCYKCDLVTDNLLLHECKLGEEKQEENLLYDSKISSPVKLLDENTAMEDSAPTLSVWTGLQCNNSNKGDDESLKVKDKANDYPGISCPTKLEIEFTKEFCEEEMVHEDASLEHRIVSPNFQRDKEGKLPKSGEERQESVSHSLGILNPVELHAENTAKHDSTRVTTVWTGLQCNSRTNISEGENLKVKEEVDDYSNLSHFDVENEVTKEEFYDEENTRNLNANLNVPGQPVFLSSREVNEKSSKQGEEKQISNPVQQVKNASIAKSTPVTTVWAGLQCNKKNNSNVGIELLKVKEEADYSDLSLMEVENKFSKEEFFKEDTNEDEDTNVSKMDHHISSVSSGEEKSSTQGKKQVEKFPCSLEVSSPVKLEVENTPMEDAATTIAVWTGLQCGSK
ncbi:uncharacterized protein [Cherax quadricarinatus]